MSNLAHHIDGPGTTGSDVSEYKNGRTRESGSETPRFEFTQPLHREQQHPVWVVQAGQRLLPLGKPIALRVFYDGEHHYAENATLDICGYGESKSAAIEDAIGDIGYLYEYYTSLSDDDLIGHGLDIKNRFKNLG